ncbi:MAG TPA: TetR family transcriptional regulator [Mycobacteriales bacterium]|nr:TetR family transcriptional regulator [Mycobacteriales bacterium]
MREQALDAAQAMLVQSGWESVTVSAVASAIGVSRPTFYKEFANKQALGEALVRRETERFLTGVAAVLDEHGGQDPQAAISAAVHFTLEEASRNPLLHAVLTSTRGGDESLLPLLTTRSGPLLEAATRALSGWFSAHLPHLPPDEVAEGVDAVVRLVVSHLVLPAAPPEQTARRLARLATRYLGVEPRPPLPGTPGV